MTDFKKDFKNLHKTYTSQLHEYHEKSFENFINNLNYFITYLKFMRDYYILTEPLVLDNGEENPRIATLATAISTYEKYQTYTDLCKTIQINTQESEALLEKYVKEKMFYWNNFWNLIRLNLEGWLNNA